MATFFGEVTEISSRAVWWSDSDDDEETDETNKLKVVTFQVDDTDQTLLDTFQSKCQLLFVSVSKRLTQPENASCIIRLKAERDEKSRKGYIASLYQLTNPTNYWLVVDNKLASEFGTFSMQLVDFIAENVLKAIKPQFDVFIISKDMTRSEYLQFFSGNFNSSSRISNLEKSIEMRPVISPETVKNDFELALVEYCIVQKQNFVCFLLPSIFTEALRFIPKQITESISEFSELSYSNIIT